MVQRSGVLIETYWNVKTINTSDNTQAVNRINRNILECKETPRHPPSQDHGGINRNILECKGVTDDTLFMQYPVLIETYWNVKESKIRQKAFFRIWY